MLIAEEASKAAAAAAATTTTSYFDFFDIIVLAFTVLIAIGVIRSLMAPKKNKLAIGFGLISLIVFLIMDVVMFQSWAG